MSTPPGADGPQYTPEQAAALAEAQQRQAAQESAGVAGQAADSAAQMTERGPLLPAETQMDAVMAALREQSDIIAQLRSQVGVMAKQQEEAQAAAGGPLTLRYAQGAADKIAAHAAQWPAHDLSAAADAAGQLVDAARAVIAGDTSVGGRLQAAESAVRRVFGKLPHIDVSAILDDVSLAVEEGLKLAAVV